MTMEHIHGKLMADDGAKVLLDEVDGYLGCHARPNGKTSYFGYFELPAAKSKGLDANAPCRLVLDDGRVGDIYADVHPGSHPGMLLAEFHVTGAIRK